MALSNPIGESLAELKALLDSHSYDNNLLCIANFNVDFTKSFFFQHLLQTFMCE